MNHHIIAGTVHQTHKKLACRHFVDGYIEGGFAWPERSQGGDWLAVTGRSAHPGGVTRAGAFR